MQKCAHCICQRDKLYMGIYYLYYREYIVYSLAYNCHISLADSAVVKLVIKMFWELFMRVAFYWLLRWAYNRPSLCVKVCVRVCDCLCVPECVPVCVCVCVRRSNLFEVVQNVLRQFSQMACAVELPQPGSWAWDWDWNWACANGDNYAQWGAQTMQNEQAERDRESERRNNKKTTKDASSKCLKHTQR